MYFSEALLGDDGCARDAGRDCVGNLLPPEPLSSGPRRATTKKEDGDEDGGGAVIPATGTTGVLLARATTVEGFEVSLAARYAAGAGVLRYFFVTST